MKERFNFKSMIKKLLDLFCRGLVISIWPVTTSLIAISCDSDDDMKFQMHGNNLPELADMKEISNQDFYSTFVGYGWYEDEVHLINEDGTIEENDYWKGIVGGPGHYNFEFTEHDVISYFYINHIPALGFRNKTYNYAGGKEGGNIIYIDGNQWMRILSVSGNIAEAIKREHANQYLYVTLRRLTDEELNELRRTYTWEYN